MAAAAAATSAAAAVRRDFRAASSPGGLPSADTLSSAVMQLAALQQVLTSTINVNLIDAALAHPYC